VSANNPTTQPANPVVPPSAPHPDDRRWFWLTAFQYLLIAVVTIIFVVAIVYGIGNLSELKDMEVARGLITFVITLGTVAIAIMLALTAVVTRDFEKRIVVGKEILTILVAVLGTIVGFYYGAASTKGTTPPANVPTVSISAPKITQSSGTATLTATLEGGAKPYHYSIKFSPETIPAIERDSADGQIKEQFKMPDTSLTEVGVTIEGKDKNGVTFVHNKDGKIKTTIQ
jgi:hypothetical protein